MVSEPFARVLAARREELNARFAAARQRWPELDGGAFAGFLREAVDPVVRAVADAHPGRVEDVALAAYDVALDLVGQRLVGGNGHEGATPNGAARGGTIVDTWRRALPAAARAVAAEPARVTAALTNAAHQVAATPGARPAQWVADVASLGARCGSAADLLRLGQVAAWRAGLAHYRRGALAAAGALPEALALAAVGGPTGARWDDVARGLAASEWYDPAATGGGVPNASPRARVAATAGAFRAFGGLFVEPPRVALAAGQLQVTSGGETWLLVADLFGATFHRVPPGERAGPWTPTSLPAGIGFTPGGTLTTRGDTVQLPAAGPATSAAATATTLAVTWALGHHVTLVALA